MPERTRKAYQKHYEEELDIRNQEIKDMTGITIGKIEEEQQEQPKKPENQEIEGPQKINPMEFLTQEDEGPQESNQLEFLGAIEPTSLEIDSMEILEQLEEQTGTPTVLIRKTNVSTELAAKENMAKQEKPLKEQVPQELHDYLSVFDKKTAERFPESRPWDHAIDLKPDFIPRDCKVYPLSLPEQQELETFVKDNLAKGYIRPSKSPMASPFFFVDKKDGKLRPCQDYRALNEGTIRNAYPLPLISDLMDKLRGARYFTKLDIRWGYNNIRIKDGDQWKGAFKTKLGLFEPTVMFFGMCNSPATFQNMMDEIFKDEINEAWVIIYMDDILIFTKDIHGNIGNITLTRRILRKLKDNDLYLKPEKCIFWAEQVDYLGFILSENRISMDPIKLKGIEEWTTPTTVKQVRSFLGFGNYYRKFIKDYGNMTQPLNELLKKDKKFEWTDDAQRAFDSLKDRFKSAPVLQLPDPHKPFMVECDASKYASGAVLQQQDSNGDWHPCAYLSKSFSETERNYEIYDRELLAIIRALTDWRHYLMGSPHPVYIRSDHKNLTYFRTAKKLNRRQARWSLFLSEFDIKLEHTPGTKMVISDALSRRPDLCQEENDNDDMTLLSDTLFVSAIDLALRDILAAAGRNDSITREALQTLKEGPTPATSTLADWTVQEGLTFYKGRCYVPDNLEVRRQIVSRYHDTLSAGHPGQLKTQELVQRDYWWPGLATFVKNYVKGCAFCQQHKINRHPTHPPLQPITSVNPRPFSLITMDFITDLPTSDGFDSIMVVVDHGSTKGVILESCNKTITAEQTGTILLNSLYKRFGLPDKAISDRGPQFASQTFRELGRLLGIKLNMSTAHHPQTDGATERSNQEIEAYLSIFCSNNPKIWNSLLPTLEFAYNSRPHATRKESPYFLQLGYDPIGIPTAYQKTNTPANEERLRILQEARKEAEAAHELARRTMMERITRGAKPFKKGEKVWLESKNLKLRYETKKLAPKREGPFEIEEVLSPLNYRLKLPKQWKIHPVFHATLLSPYLESDIHGKNFSMPPPDLINGEHEYEVEAIVTHKPQGRRNLYLVKWKGYPTSDNTWEPERNLDNAKQILEVYKDQHNLL